tara:strand:+ start:511 stop:750 length:240 start_codon:yes stop_codon:yes gene_type:complete
MTTNYEHVTVEQMVEAMRGLLKADRDNDDAILHYLNGSSNNGCDAPMFQLEQEGQVEIPSHLTASGNPEHCCVQHIPSN